MAESTINMTEGSGKKQHTWNRTIGANSVEDDFNLPGEYPYASYTIDPEAAISTATAAAHILQVMAGASLNVRIRRVQIFQDASATAVAVGRFSIVRLTTAGTGGTAVTPSKLDNADGASGATAMTLPTVKGAESTFLYARNLLMRQALAATAAQADDRVWEWAQLPNSKPIIIPAGTANGIAIKNTSAIAAGTVVVYVEFVETAFV